MTDQSQYDNLNHELRTLHAALIKLQDEGKLSDARENAGLIGDHLMQMRLKCSLLMRFKNDMIDVHSKAAAEYAAKREEIYHTLRKEGKTPSAAQDEARERTRMLEADVTVAKNNVNKVSNDYERYNPICLSLQSRMREFSTERMVG